MTNSEQISNEIITTELSLFFLAYIKAFNEFDLTSLQHLYLLPCSLHTPDKIAMLTSIDDFNREFSQIFTVLKQAQVEQLIATNASFTEINPTTIAVCIDWAFIDKKAQVFADFTAFYHLSHCDNTLKIINVVSHELDNGLALSSSLPQIIKYSH